MKKYLFLILLITFLGISKSSLADQGDGCHFHGSKPAAESVILKCANQRKVSLVKSNKLDKSWETINHSSIDLMEGKKGKEWKVVYKNPNITDKTKISLYMFFTPSGNFIASNHTGQ
jgi:hypothetical protein